MTPLARVESERTDAECVVRVRGEIDLSNTDDVASAIEAAVGSGVARAIVDLSETTYLDSVGVRLLMVIAQRLGSRRQELRLRVPEGSPIRATLDVAGVGAAIPIDLV